MLNLIEKYNLKRDGYHLHNLVDSSALAAKWEKYFGEGWYGIDLGLVPYLWLIVIDEFLTNALEKYPELQIQQIKVKYGEVRIYITPFEEELQSSARNLEDVLFDSRLVY